jgi:hypothetical protein
MSARSLNGLNGTNTNVVITNRMLTTLPLEMTQNLFTDPIVMSMKGLNGFGGANKVIKVNSSNNGLIYADDLTENITVSSPLVRTADNISIIGLSTTFSGAGKVVKINSNNDGLEYADDLNENITVSSPLVRTADNISIIGLSTTFSGAGKIVKINSSNNGLEYTDDIWTASSNIIRPTTSSNNNIILLNSTLDSAIYGDQANPSNEDYPYIKYGSFETLYGKDTRHISASIQNHTSGSVKSVNLTCNANSNLLEIDNSINVNGNIECDFIKLTNSTNQIKTGSLSFSLPSTGGTLALTTDIGTTIWSVSSFTLTPQNTNNNIIKLIGSQSKILGDISNPINTNYPYMGLGSFYTLYTNQSYSGQIALSNSTAQITNAGKSFNLPSTSGTLALTTDELWEETSSGLTLNPKSFYTMIDLGSTRSNYTNLNPDVRVIPTGSLSSGQLISYGSGVGGGNGSMIFGTNSTSASSGWDTGLYAKQFINMNCGSYDIAEFSVSPSAVKQVHLKGKALIDSTIKCEGNFEFLNSSNQFSLPTNEGSGAIDYTLSSSGLSRQGNGTNRIYTKAFRFSATTDTTLYSGTNIEIEWDGTAKQIKFNLLTSLWYDASVFHIAGSGTSTGSLSPTISYSVDDINSTGTGLYLTVGGTINSSFGLFDYGTRVQAHLCPEGLYTSNAAFRFDVMGGNTSTVNIIMNIINSTYNN